MKPLLLSAALALATLAHAEIVDSADNGFTVHHKVIVNAPPEHVWTSLLDIPHWWNGQHSWSGDAANFTFDARAGGCWCETLPHGSAQIQTVVFVDANRILRLSGALGPMQGMGLSGSSTFMLHPHDKGTELDFTYIASGYKPGGLVKFAPNVDGVLSEAVGRLKRFAETGKPTE